MGIESGAIDSWISQNIGSKIWKCGPYGTVQILQKNSIQEKKWGLGVSQRM
jgi:hypothetical protein